MLSMSTDVNQPMLNYKSVIDNFDRHIHDDTRRLVQDIVSVDTKLQVYFFGRNELSLGLSKLIPAVGFIDDYAPVGSSWYEKPVMRLDNVDTSALIVNCVTCNLSNTAQSLIFEKGFTLVLTYADLCRALPELVPLPEFVTQTRNDILSYPEKWSKVYNCLADQESKKTFNDVLNFRLTADPAALNNYRYRPADQYFEEFMHFQNEIFVDAGGFDGDTSEQFCLRYPDYKKIYLFEPSKDNMERAKQRLEKYKNIEFIEMGLSDNKGELFFDSSAGSSCAVTDAGDTVIRVTTIDECIDGSVSFIKMDLEGWEYKALQGSRQHILRDHPKLAIAVYHNASDFWRIFEFVKSMRPDYNVFLRHYTEGWAETIMFFYPITFNLLENKLHK